jgi:hypothetical protein
MECERGAVDVAFTLAPTNPPRTQYLRFTPVMPLDPRLKEIVAEAAKSRAADLARAGYGTCRIGETISGNGRAQAAVRLDCDRGAVTLRVDSGDRITLAPAPGACVP